MYASGGSKASSPLLLSGLSAMNTIRMLLQPGLGAGGWVGRVEWGGQGALGRAKEAQEQRENGGRALRQQNKQKAAPSQPGGRNSNSPLTQKIAITPVQDRPT